MIMVMYLLTLHLWGMIVLLLCLKNINNKISDIVTIPFNNHPDLSDLVTIPLNNHPDLSDTVTLPFSIQPDPTLLVNLLLTVIYFTK